jgi:hypothetical protein
VRAETLRIDIGWILQLQAEHFPEDPSIRDWAALQCVVDRHCYERERGVPYYEEAPTRAAVLLHTMVLLEPFADWNGAIGALVARTYMEQSGMPIVPPPGGLVELISRIRSGKLKLASVARELRAWAE